MRCHFSTHHTNFEQLFVFKTCQRRQTIPYIDIKLTQYSQYRQSLRSLLWPGYIRFKWRTRGRGGTGYEWIWLWNCNFQSFVITAYISLFSVTYDLIHMKCSCDVIVMILVFCHTGSWLSFDTRRACEPLGMRRIMTSSNGSIIRVTGPLCGEFTGHRWIPNTKASDAELWCFLWSAPE